MKLGPKDIVEVGKIHKGVTVYAAAEDFCRIFKEDMGRLYLLSLLLTADHREAERCFIAAVEDCIQRNTVFKEYAPSWSRRTIIKNAIRTTPCNTTQVDENEFGNSDIHNALTAVTRLEPFERFVFVLSVLERYSDQECSILLDSTRMEVIRARRHALQNVASIQPIGTRTESVSQFAVGDGVALNPKVLIERE